MIAKLLICLLALVGSTAKPELKQSVDLMEVNHHYNEGFLAYEQVILYEWSPDYRRYHVIAWLLVDQNPDRLPRKDHDRNDYVVSYFDPDARQRREIRSPLLRHTWTQTDPERINKLMFGEKYRTGLIRR